VSKLADMSVQPRVSLGQFAPGVDPVSNLRALREQVLAARKAGSTLAVFPEYSFSFEPGGVRSGVPVESLDGSWVASLSELSAEAEGITIVAGALLAKQSVDKPVNTMVAVGPQGVLATAEKIHLYDAFGASESEWISPGDAGQVHLFEWAGFQVGMMACYDLRFPEVGRALVDAGATAIVVPAQWVPGEDKVLHWDTLLRSRAIELQCSVIAVNHPLPHGIGHSQVFDASGHVVLRLGEQEILGTASCELQMVEQARSINPMGSVRRFDVAAKRATQP
jgi:predicted amidohydrolase